MKKYIVFFVVLIVQSLLGQSSVPSISFNKLQSLPPEVSKMLEYGDYTLNYTKAMPNISLPIYTIKTKTGLEIPISLDYASSGIKVNELASNVGLGWLLNAYGVISVDNKQEYDLGVHIKDKLQAYSSSNVSNIDNKTQDLYSYLSMIKRGDISGKVPIYSYNFLGNRGKVIFDSQGKSFGIPLTDIEFILSKDLKEISVKDLQGNIYYFLRRNFGIDSDKYIEGLSKENYTYILNKIKLSNNELVEFVYYNEGIDTGFLYHYELSYHYDRNFSKQEEDSNDGTFYNNNCSRDLWPEDIKTKVYGKTPNLNIKEIKYSGTIVRFKYSHEDGLGIENLPYRKDVGLTAKALRRIEILYDNKLVDSYVLDYSYFTSSDSYNKTIDRPEIYRLKLLSLTKNKEEKHQFEYFENVKLPPRDSFSMDEWGYFNGMNNNTLLPSISFGLGDESKSISLDGANRSISSMYIESVKAYSLKKIIYPSKGYTVFYYDQPIGTKYNTIKRTKFVDGEAVGIYYSEDESIESRTGTIDISKFKKYDPNKGDRVSIVFTNTCDNAYKSEKENLDQFVGEGSNGVIGVSFEEPTTLGRALYDTKHFSTPKNLSFNNVILRGKIGINVFRQGKCQVSVGIGVHRDSSYRISFPEKLPLVYLRKYVSYNDKGEILKEVFYKYNESGKGSPNVSSESPVFSGVSKRTANRFGGLNGGAQAQVCTAIVRSSQSLAKTSEPYFSTIYEYEGDRGSTHYIFSGDRDVEENVISTHGYSYPIVSHLGSPSFEFENEFVVDNSWRRGNLLRKEIFDSEGKIKYSLVNSYQYDKSLLSKSTYALKNSGGIAYNVFIKDAYLRDSNTSLSDGSDNVRYQLEPITSSWIKKIKEVERFYSGDNFIEKQKIFKYDKEDVFLPTEIKTISNDNEFVERFTYPEKNSVLYQNNRKGTLVKYESNKNNEKLQTIENVYKDWKNNIIDKEEIKISKGTSGLTSNQKILHRDIRNGNIIELEDSGVKEVYLYGYNNTLLIAKIENTSKEQVASALGVSVANLHTIDENKLSQINNLRTNSAFKEALITTYEHRPLVGVAKITDPKGGYQIYEYDSANRLKAIKNQDGHVLSEYDYNYKNN